MSFWKSCFFYNPTDVSNLISGSSAFSKSNLNIWKILVNFFNFGFFFFFYNFWTDVPLRVWDLDVHVLRNMGTKFPNGSTVLRHTGSCVDPYQNGGLLSSPYGMQTEQEVTLIWSESVVSPNFQCWIFWVFFNLSHRAFYYLNNNFVVQSLSRVWLSVTP